MRCEEEEEHNVAAATGLVIDNIYNMYRTTVVEHVCDVIVICLPHNSDTFVTSMRYMFVTSLLYDCDVATRNW